MAQFTAGGPDTPDKWEVQLRKGGLELAILASLWTGRLYGLEILRRLESDSDLVVSEGTVYPLLSRLKVLGLVDSEWVESDAGHPRKYYSLTRAGRERALEMLRVWTRFSTSIGKLLAPLEKEQ
jgi:PadR family transcriptional regulator, regulatory protein PadR